MLREKERDMQMMEHRRVNLHIIYELQLINYKFTFFITKLASFQIYMMYLNLYISSQYSYIINTVLLQRIITLISIFINTLLL